MAREFTAIYERDGDWVIGYCSRGPRRERVGADEGRMPAELGRGGDFGLGGPLGGRFG